jgi:hypothetical protein
MNGMKQVFTIGIKKSVIDDLRNRLAATRWTDEIENDKWQYGTNEKYLGQPKRLIRPFAFIMKP